MFVLRIGVAGGEQRFIFACPLCGVELRGTLFGEPAELQDFIQGHGPRIELRSEDFSELDFDDRRDDGSLAVTVYTDLPVPTSMQGMPAGKAMMSPFILATQLCGSEDSVDLWGRIEGLRAMRVTLHAVDKLADGLKVDRRRPALHLHCSANALSDRHDIRALVEATLPLHVLIAEELEELGDRSLELEAVHVIDPLEARVRSEHMLPFGSSRAQL